MNAPANDNAAPATTAPAGNPRRRTALTAIAVAVLVIGGGYGIYYWMTGRHSESTDNAYVQANVVQITAQAGGTVTAIQAYNQQVIDAVREAADAATSAASIGRQLTLQRQALEASTASYDFSQSRYGQGLGNLLIVLNAETQMLNERRLEVDLEYRAIDVQAQLMKALGGGWTAGATAAPPAAAASAPTTTAKNDNLTPA